VNRGENRARLALVGLIAGLLLAAPAADAKPGDVYVADRDAETIWKLPPTGGEATVLSNDPDLSRPYGMTLGPDGLLYVADSAGKVFSVDRTTGATAEVTDLTGFEATDVAFDAAGRLLVTEYDENDILVVSRTTGLHSVLYDGPGLF